MNTLFKTLFAVFALIVGSAGLFMSVCGGIFLLFTGTGLAIITIPSLVIGAFLLVIVLKWFKKNYVESEEDHPILRSLRGRPRGTTGMLLFIVLSAIILGAFAIFKYLF